MKKKFLPALLILIVLCLTARAYPQSETKSTPPAGQAPQSEFIPQEQIAAKVNGVPITKDEVNRVVATMKETMAEAGKYYQMPQFGMDFFIKQAMEKLISSELVFQRAVKMKITVSEEELEQELKKIRENVDDKQYEQRLRTQNISEQDFKNSVKKSMYIQKMLDKEVPYSSIKISDSELGTMYEKYRYKLTRSDDMIKLSQIVMAVKDNDSQSQIESIHQKMLEAKKKLDAGADWYQIVAQYSQGTKENGGSIGYFPKTMLFQKLGNDFVPSQVNEISNVVKTNTGYHIFKVDEIKTKGGLMSLEESRMSLEKIIMDQKYGEILNKYVADLKKEAKIETFIK